MVQKNSSFKQCATCENWCGARGIDYHRMNVQLNENYEVGECTDGPWNRAKKQENFTCPNWKKWSNLK